MDSCFPRTWEEGSSEAEPQHKLMKYKSQHAERSVGRAGGSLAGSRFTGGSDTRVAREPWLLPRLAAARTLAQVCALRPAVWACPGSLPASQPALCTWPGLGAPHTRHTSLPRARLTPQLLRQQQPERGTARQSKEEAEAQSFWQEALSGSHPAICVGLFPVPLCSPAFFPPKDAEPFCVGTSTHAGPHWDRPCIVVEVLTPSGAQPSGTSSRDRPGPVVPHSVVPVQPWPAFCAFP